MNPPPLKLIQVPEEELKRLLAANGETLEIFLKQSTGRIEAGNQYQKRARIAYWSIFWLGLSTLFSLFEVLTSFGIEGLLSTLLLGGMTFVEINVRKWFLAGDERGAIYGYWNQTLFALLFLAYGAYHTLYPEVPKELNQMLGDDYDALFTQVSGPGYTAIGLVGAICQYALALYYRRARKLLLNTRPLPIPPV